MIIDLSSFSNALRSLQEAVAVFERNRYDLLVRDAVIQRFEYTYELSFKMMKRFLKEANVGDVDQMFFQEVVREADAKGFLRNGLEKWLLYRNMRNTTAHTYDGGKAELVVVDVPDFVAEAEFLLAALTAKQAET